MVGLLLVSGAFAKPPPLDAAGRLVFDTKVLRHPANEPYFCFTLVDGTGVERKRCNVIQDWCAADLNTEKVAERPILSGCRPVDTVSCYVVSPSAMIRTPTPLCWETPADCEAMNARQVESTGAKAVSVCQTFDKAFQPGS